MADEAKQEGSPREQHGKATKKAGIPASAVASLVMLVVIFEHSLSDRVLAICAGLLVLAFCFGDQDTRVGLFALFGIPILGITTAVYFLT